MTSVAGVQQTSSHFFFDVAALLFIFYKTYATNYGKTCNLMPGFHPADLPLTAKAQLARYAIKSRDRKVNLNLGAERRAFGGEDEHATHSHVRGVTHIVVFCAIGPAEQDWHQNSKPMKRPTINRAMHFDRTMHFDFWLFRNWIQHNEPAGALQAGNSAWWGGWMPSST
ncbi:MAG: hypothetical protein WBW02_21240 [Candidatus Sulfotelmatobacter sp.]